MSLSFEQRLRLRLAGTIRLPEPFPETGQVSFESTDTTGTDPLDGMVTVKYDYSPRRTVCWVFHSSDLVAFNSNPDSRPPVSRPGAWRLDADALRYLAGQTDPISGAVCVRESAQVLIQTEVGVTAAECHHGIGEIMALGCCPHEDPDVVRPRGCCPHECD